MRTLLVVLGGLLILTSRAQADDSATCAFAAGDLPAVTLPTGTPHGAQIPVDTIVVLMQENRSFDHYFGHLHAKGLEQEPKGASNPDPLGGAPIKAFHAKPTCEVTDLDHSWNGTHRSWNGGAMDGFTAANADPLDPSGSRTMGYHTAKELPVYYKLYKTFAIGDRYFSSLLSQTFPNRFYLLAGTSFGHIRNDIPFDPAEFSQRSVFNILDEAGITWKVYYSQLPFAFTFAYARVTGVANLVPIAQYFTDAQNGTLPQVSFVDPIFSSTRNVENDEHPPANVQVGQEFVGRVISALTTSPQWLHSALFLTYDEHGGFYDHVPPPAACAPDGIPPMLEPGDEPGAFNRYGVRVPASVISPYAKKRFVSHVVHDHTSILRFIETRFDLPALTRRDANADPMLEFFDFSKVSFKRPPHVPPGKINAKRKAECDALGEAPSDGF
jgi:phospholipase C